MRQLNDQELRTFFEKLSKYIGQNIEFLVDRKDEPHVFRLIKDRVYYMSESLMKISSTFSRDKLLHVGTCFGKFTKTGKFRLHITALDIIAKYALKKVWVKPSGEQNFIYGNHLLKAHLAKITEGSLRNDGVVVYNMKGIPLGFGALARGPEQFQMLDPTAIIVFNQADIGEYLRVENQ